MKAKKPIDAHRKQLCAIRIFARIPIDGVLHDLLEEDDGFSTTVACNPHGEPYEGLGNIPAREEPAGKEADETSRRGLDEDLEPTKRRWRVLEEPLKIGDESRKGGDPHPGGKFRDGIARFLVQRRSPCAGGENGAKYVP